MLLASCEAGRLQLPETAVDVYAKVLDENVKGQAVGVMQPPVEPGSRFPVPQLEPGDMEYAIRVIDAAIGNEWPVAQLPVHIAQ